MANGWKLARSAALDCGPARDEGFDRVLAVRLSLAQSHPAAYRWSSIAYRAKMAWSQALLRAHPVSASSWSIPALAAVKWRASPYSALVFRFWPGSRIFSHGDGDRQENQSPGPAKRASDGPGRRARGRGRGHGRRRSSAQGGRASCAGPRNRRRGRAPRPYRREARANFSAALLYLNGTEEPGTAALNARAGIRPRGAAPRRSRARARRRPHRCARTRRARPTARRAPCRRPSC